MIDRLKCTLTDGRHVILYALTQWQLEKLQSGQLLQLAPTEGDVCAALALEPVFNTDLVAAVEALFRARGPEAAEAGEP